MELTKHIVRVGNSAGVILPREWLHGEARVTLVKRPENPVQEIIEIVRPYLSSIVGLYLVGSYARGEQTDKSDVDVLAVTTDISKKIKRGKYEITLVSQKEVEQSLKNNILPLLPMIREASPIINANLLEAYTKTQITKQNLKWHRETTTSALELLRTSISLAREEDTSISDNILYSLVLRLREAYIVDCLMHNKKATTTDLIALIKRITGSIEAYKAYQRSKAHLKTQKKVSVKEAEALYHYLENKIKEQEEWIKRNG